MSTGEVLTVSQLNRYVKYIVEQDENLKTVFVVGEISNFTNHYRTGHYYLTLKDEQSSIKAVMFKSANSRLRFMPENSMNVIVRGRVAVFERDGVYQLYIDDMQPDGAGALSVAFEQLKNKLAAKGLFDIEKKKPIPKFPQRVGVVTSPTGAAIQDIINIISRRFPSVELILNPVSVQGENAAGQIASAIKAFNAAKGADVLIVGRGGGSLEDLWAFNEEIVALAVAESEIPVISAVGHETDFTICDFVADLRAPTPSAAAELAVPDCRQQKQFIRAANERMLELVCRAYDLRRSYSELLTRRLEAADPEAYIRDLRVRCDKAAMKMDSFAFSATADERERLAALCAKLDAMSPLKILGRGYAVAVKDGKSLTDVGKVNVGDEINILLANGSLDCTVGKIKEN